LYIDVILFAMIAFRQTKRPPREAVFLFCVSRVGQEPLPPVKRWFWELRLEDG